MAQTYLRYVFTRFRDSIPARGLWIYIHHPMESIADGIQQAHPRRSSSRGVWSGMRRQICGLRFLGLSRRVLFTLFAERRACPRRLAIHSSPTQRLLQATRLPLTFLELFQLLPPRFQRILRHLVLHVLLVTIRQQLLDNGSELSVLV